MSINSRDGRLFIQFQYNKQTYKKTLPKSTSRKVAGEIENKWRLDLILAERRLQQSEQTDQTFAYFVAHTYMPYVKANHSDASHDKAWLLVQLACSMFGKLPLRSIKSADIERFKTLRMGTPTIHGTIRKPATVHRELAIISKVFSMAVNNDLCDYNPVARIDKPKFDNVQNRILHSEDERRLFGNIHGEWTRDVCLMALNTGLRQNDILGLERKHIDWNENTIRLVQGKTSRGHVLPMNDTVRSILKSRWDNGSKYFFPSPKTGKPQGSVRHSLERACLRAGIPKLTIRDLRRSFGTRVIMEGADAVTAARLLGHSDQRSIHRYVRSAEMMQKAVDSLAKSTASLPEQKERSGGRS
jgi:integrase